MYYKTIENGRTLSEWTERYAQVEMTIEESELLLGYVVGHGYRLGLDESNKMYLVDIEDSMNDDVEIEIYDLIQKVSLWNYEFIQDSEIAGDHREQILKDLKVIDRLLGNCRLGIPIGMPTVKELIAILSRLPEDYRVYCCGGENYLYLWEDNRSITIDCEYYLS